MRILLDTCIIAYMALEPDRLSHDVLSIQCYNGTVYSATHGTDSALLSDYKLMF